MRLVIAFVAALTAAATSHAATADVFAQDEAIVELSIGEEDPALEWHIDVAGGSSSSDHLILAPVALGFRGEFTVAVAGSTATVMLTTVLPADIELVSVGCLDDLTIPTEIQPIVDRASFILEVVPGRRYSCFAASLPVDSRGPAEPAIDTSLLPIDRPLPRSDSTEPSAPSPGWPAVVVALVLITGIAVLLRPARR